MKREFIHFTTPPVYTDASTPAECADLIENLITDIISRGEKTGSITIDVPDNLTDEEANKFIDEIMKRLNERGDM